MIQRVTIKLRFLISPIGRRRLRLLWIQLIRGNFKLVYHQAYRFLRSSNAKNQSDRIIDVIQLLKSESIQVTTLTMPFKSDIGVVIPIFNNVDDLENLVLSLSKQTTLPSEVVLIDDASSNLEVKGYLEQIEKKFKFVSVVFREINGGFPVTVNQGLSQLKTSIRIILNSDVKISKFFIERMSEPFKSNSSIGSVTAITNHGSIAAIPSINATTGSLLCSVDLDKVNEKLRVLHQSHFPNNKWPRIPVGVGHAMAFRADTLINVGYLDSETFSPGYGEEVDWSLRASQNGWIHVLHPSNFVLHAEGKSFGLKRNWLIAEHNKIINNRYPQFQSLVDYYVSSDELKQYRLAASLSILTLSSEIKLFANISHGKGGGSSLWNYHKTGKQLYSISFKDDGPFAQIKIQICDFTYNYSSNWREAFEFLRLLRPNFLEIGSIALIQQNDQEQFLNLLNDLLGELEDNCEKSLVLHDYHSICPSYNLLDFRGDFCEVPNLKKCESCITVNNFIPTQSRKTGIQSWRNRYLELIEKCDSVIFLSYDSQNWFQKAFPTTLVNKKVIQLSDWINFPAKKETSFSRVLSNNPARRILFMGNLNYAKGSEIVNMLANLSEYDSNKELEFHLLGALDVNPHKNLKLHGNYIREELSSKLISIKPDFVFFASIWPETYCIAAEEAARLGYRIITFDIGAVPEREKSHVGQVKLPIKLSNDIPELFKVLKTLE